MTADQGRFLIRGLASRDWRPAPGRVLAAAVLRSSTTASARGGWYPPGILLSYEYMVAGQRYEGHQSSWRGYAPTMTAAMRVALQYRPGRHVTVWYNPAEPTEAVLERGAGVGNLLTLLVSAGVLGLGLYWLIGLGAA